MWAWQTKRSRKVRRRMGNGYHLSRRSHYWTRHFVSPGCGQSLHFSTLLHVIAMRRSEWMNGTFWLVEDFVCLVRMIVLAYTRVNVRVYVCGLRDTAGQERFRSMTRCQYRGTKVSLPDFDVKKFTAQWLCQTLTTCFFSPDLHQVFRWRLGSAVKDRSQVK